MAHHPAMARPTTDEIAAQAALLRNAHSTRRTIPPIRNVVPGATVDDAMAMQEVNAAFWESEGRTIVGAKIGLTAQSVQAQLGVEQPDFGHLFADMAVPDGHIVAAGRLIAPKVEGEIAFVLARAPDAKRLTTAEMIDCVDYVLPSLEIIDSRIDDWDIGIVDTIADNASTGAFVLGTTPVFLRDVDLRCCGMTLERNGEPVSFGTGAACLGHPLHALAWLAGKMAEVGRPLGKGDIVLSGALGPIVSVSPGDFVEARFDRLGTVRVRF